MMISLEKSFVKAHSSSTFSVAQVTKSVAILLSLVRFIVQIEFYFNSVYREGGSGFCKRPVLKS